MIAAAMRAPVRKGRGAQHERQAPLELDKSDKKLAKALLKQVEHQDSWVPLAPILDPLAAGLGGGRGRDFGRRHSVDAGEQAPLLAGFEFLQGKENRTAKMVKLDQEMASLAAGGHRGN